MELEKFRFLSSKNGFLFILLFLVLKTGYSQLPFYYTLKKINGTVFTIDSIPVHVKFKSRNKLLIENNSNPDLDTFLRTLTITKLSRKYLEHLLTTAAEIRVEVTNKVGIMKKDGKYRLIAGLTGPENCQSDELIKDSTSNLRTKKCNKWNLVFKANTLQLFKGSLTYINHPFALDSSNAILFDYSTNAGIEIFCMDTIKIEPILNPDLLYKNNRALYYFCGIHELVHTTAENIERQVRKTDPESPAYDVERKAYRKRKKVNRKR